MLAQSKITVGIGAISRATRIPVNTIRTWEKRYGFPQPNRTESGHRLYSPDVITHLRLVAIALDQGHRAGQVLSLKLAELQSLIGDQQTLVPTRQPSTQIDDLLDAARAFDAETLVVSFRRFVAQAGLIQFVMLDVPQLLHAIGKAWEDKRLEVEHEHFASECLRDFLSNEWRPLAEGGSGRKVVLATLPGESHSLGLHMVACLYAFHGYQVFFLGRNMPVANLVTVSKKLNTDVLSLSISSYANVLKTRTQLEALIGELPLGIKLHLGGSGAPDDMVGTLRFGEVRDLYTFLDEQK
jgi:methanogenic corrinoid protein MtbC1